MKNKTWRKYQNVWHGIILILLIAAVVRIATVIVPRIKMYTEPYYTEYTYKTLEMAFNSSQYRQKDNPGIIPDETVYSYAAGAYLRGVDPILINSERAPLGKYFFSLSILLFHNDITIILSFGLLTLVALWFLGTQILQDRWLAIIPVAILSFEPLFLNQFQYVPLLDIVQIPFIMFSMYFFIREEKHGTFWITSGMVGLVMATKTIYTGLLLFSVFGIYLAMTRQYKKILYLLLSMPVSVILFCLSYLRTFLSGYSLYQFFGFQKWILQYDQSKLLYPLSIWRLVFVNQWQAWWGDFRILRADDWQITWPIFTGLTFLTGVLVILRKVKTFPGLSVALLWILAYGIFISLGISSSRFLLPLLPVCYIIGTFICFKRFLS
jgi:hypothetical protein